ncbi:hypothetical protein [Luteibacter yeojuensis]|uniref:Uncharacterized protein n=1 Tax=Luteibacter yeojuensis TaxID=345309 RepID=A0A0F3L372_9GAMM|nr:hypothetical protein [Luteibacter yeojuensis]KJV36794.1 hypothetical protein VI08_03300 [Luteibacter yeojuensis]
MELPHSTAPAADRPSVAHHRPGRARRTRPDHAAPRARRPLSAKVRRYLWYTAAAVGIYGASLAYAHLEEASHQAVQATNAAH